MAGNIAINLEHVCAIFERYINNPNFDMQHISDGRVAFTIDWGNLLQVYGAPFAALLEIIAEEEEVIVPIDASYLRQFPDPIAAQEVRQNCRTIVCTRSMPHNRAHWIMREIFGDWGTLCRHIRVNTARTYAQMQAHPVNTELTQDIRRIMGILFPTQEHINVMIANHEEFVSWARQSGISDYDESVHEDLCRNYECVVNGLFPYAFGTVDASCFNVDEYFRALDYDFYHVIQTLRIQRPDNQPYAVSNRIEDDMKYILPNVLRHKRIAVDRKMHHIFRVDDWHTWSCLRTFKKPATVRHQKRIHDGLRSDRELRMSKYFLDHAAPWLCHTGVMKNETVPNVMRYCPVTRPALE